MGAGILIKKILLVGQQIFLDMILKCYVVNVIGTATCFMLV